MIDVEKLVRNEQLADPKDAGQVRVLGVACLSGSSPHGYRCNRGEDHVGQHVAMSPSGLVYDAWPNEAAVAAAVDPETLAVGDVVDPATGKELRVLGADWCGLGPDRELDGKQYYCTRREDQVVPPTAKRESASVITLDNCKTGDPIAGLGDRGPNHTWCGNNGGERNVGGRYLCTRPAGHAGQHVCWRPTCSTVLGVKPVEVGGMSLSPSFTDVITAELEKASADLDKPTDTHIISLSEYMAKKGI